MKYLTPDNMTFIPELEGIDTSLFCEEADRFRKYGYYCKFPKGTKDYINYWDEQKRRRIEGYEISGVKITGEHYGYLNFSRILKVEELPDGRKRNFIDFPTFYDMDYQFFWALNEAKRQNKGLIVAKARRKGFEQPYSECVMTPTGPSTMGEIKEGDFVLTPNGKAKVLEKFEQGEKDVYEIKFLDGRIVKCGKDHLWEVWCKGRGKKYKKILTTEQLINGNLTREINKGKNREYKYHVRQIDKVEYENSSTSLPIDPYVLGLLIGDGTINRALKIASADQEILDAIQDRLGDEYTLVHDETTCNYRIVYYNVHHPMLHIKYNKPHRGYKINPLKEEIKRLQLDCKGETKFIPDIYKYSSINDRYDLIKGLLDTDGSINKYGNIDFSTCSLRLAEDFCFVVRSLGINCTFDRKLKSNGAYRVYIRSNENLFKLPRKSDRVREKNINKYTAIVEINKLDYKEKSACILIDSKDHVYLTKDFIPTHNSFKNAWLVANEFNLIRESISVVGAYLDGLADNTIGMIIEDLDFLNKHTAWGRQRNPDRRDFMKAQFKQTVNGTEVWSGYKSEIHKITFKDDAFKAIGKATSLFLWEEAGKMPNLIRAYTFSQPTWKDGDIMRGTPIIFGTGGDIEGGTQDFAEMYYNPRAYDLLEFDNIWDEGKSGTKSGLFIPNYLAKPPYIDKYGNSLIEIAKESDLKEREKKLKGVRRRSDYDNFVSQNAWTPQEAFVLSKGNKFPAALLARQLAKIEAKKELKYLKDIGRFDLKQDGTVEFVPDPRKKPLDWPFKKDEFGLDKEGAVIIYEHPSKPNQSDYGEYFATCDPYDQDEANNSQSVGSCIVWKTLINAGEVYDLPVATYHGRPEKAKEFYEIVRRMCLYYNAVCLYENEKRGLEWYFEERGQSYLLKDQPDILDKIIKNSSVKRPKGTHMVPAIKTQCELWGYDWLVEEQGELLNLNKLYDEFLIKQLISYNDEGNFDAVIAFLLAILYRKELKMEMEQELVKKNYLLEDKFFQKELFQRNQL